jgi:glutamate-5-semialdehyde dehydrogenase
MAITTQDDLQSYCMGVAHRAKETSQELATLSRATKDAWLLQCADYLEMGKDRILWANQQDLDAADAHELSEAQLDRLKLTEPRIHAIAQGLRQIAALPDPVGEIVEGQRRPNGMLVTKVRVPLGVVFFIYESRPNVTADAAAICVKSGNAVILRGGKEAVQSNRVIVEMLCEQAEAHGLPAHVVQMVQRQDRGAIDQFLKLSSLIDVAIPRGGEGLIRRVAEHARMPVIKHYDGNCHVYVDRSASLQTALDIVENSKCHRMGVCNACESLLVHRDIAATFLPRLVDRLRQYNIEFRADPDSLALIPGAVPATEHDWATEYLGPVLSVKIVDSLPEAIQHINCYGSHHTDAIVTCDLAASQAFTQRVDSAAVVVNASTRLHDGGEFGMGAEIGISTDKFHARGPCGLKELTSYKYVVWGEGQIRT